MNDLIGIGKVLPIDKLLAIVERTCGRVFKSYFDKRDIDNEVYREKEMYKAKAFGVGVMADALKKNLHLTDGIKYCSDGIEINSQKERAHDFQNTKSLDVPIEIRASERAAFQETNKQFNVENVTSIAMQELMDERPIIDEPLDEDWTTRFFRIVEDVSNEEMQVLWGKVLAGEIKQPKSYSLRTLELLRNLSQKEAEIFLKVANFAIREEGKSNFLFTSVQGTSWDDEHNINHSDIKYTDIALLTEIGLIQSGASVGISFDENSKDSFQIFIIGNIAIIIKIKANTPSITMPVVIFSTAGNELINLLELEPSMAYLRLFAKSIKERENVEVKYCSIILDKGQITSFTYPLENL